MILRGALDSSCPSELFKVDKPEKHLLPRGTVKDFGPHEKMSLWAPPPLTAPLVLTMHLLLDIVALS